MNKEEKTITLGNELYEEFIEGKQTIDTHELLNLFAKRINNLQSKIDKVNQYLEERFIFDDENGEYYQTHTFDKNNAKELHDILKEDK